MGLSGRLRSARLERVDPLLSFGGRIVWRRQVSLIALILLASGGGLGAAEPHAVQSGGEPVVPRVIAPDSCAWPAMARLPDGTMLVANFNRPSHGRMVGDVDCWASTDQGVTWTNRGPAAPHEPGTLSNRMNVAFGVTNRGEAILVASGWTLHQVGTTGDTLEIAEIQRSWVCRSADAGRSWRIDKQSFPEFGPDGGRLIPFGRIQAGQDHALVVPAYSVLANPADAKHHVSRTYLYRSGDNGVTWSAPAPLDPAMQLGETTLLYAGQGRWLAFARGERLFEYESTDDARSWRQVGPVTPTSCYPGNAIRLSSGEILLTYGNRIKNDTGVDAKLSRDEGVTWSEPVRLVDVLIWDAGYPSCLELPGGKIVTTYYARKAAYHDGYHLGAVTWDYARSFRSVRGWAGWELRAAPGALKFVGATLAFDRPSSDGKSDPCAVREVPYERAYFRFHARYKTDGHLAPTVLLYFLHGPDVRPLTILRLPAARHWTDFTTVVLGHASAAMELRVYPGTVDDRRLGAGGLKAQADFLGRVEFASVSWEKLDRPVAELEMGPVPFATKSVVFKSIGPLALKIHLDLPEHLTPGRPTLVWFHGGGWIGGTPDNCKLQTSYFASRGIACARPQYRLVQQGGNLDTTLQDVRDAVAWLRSHAADYGIDATRLVLAGTSAGGHLGALVAGQTPECVGFIGLSGVYNLVDVGDSASGRNTAFFTNDPANWRRSSPIYQLSARFPPTILVHGAVDATVDCRQSRYFAQAINRAGGHADLVIIPELNHVPNLDPPEVFKRIEGFLTAL